MEREPSRAPELNPNQQRAKDKAKEFFESLRDSSPQKKLRYLSLFTYVDREEYIASLEASETTHAETARSRPTVLLFPGIFREAKEMGADLAVINHVFNANVVVVDYAALASQKGLSGIMEGLQTILEKTEGKRDPGAPTPQRIIVGESLGGIVAQAVSLASAGNPELEQRMNIKHLVLSHTVPPPLIDRRLVLFGRFLRLFRDNVPMQVARPLIDRILERAHRVNRHNDEQSAIDQEWSAVHDILRRDRSLTARRGYGYTQSALDAIDATRKSGTRNKIPTSIIFSNSDKLFKSVPLADWKRYHENISITELNVPFGHATSGLKETYLTDVLVPMLAGIDILPITP